jgi:predicted nucleotidyltransferase
MTDLGILAEDLGVSERTLRRAANEGALRVRRPTPRRVEIAQREKAYIRRSWPLLSELRRVLRTEHNARLVVLFGSAARGEDGPGSDIDLVLAMREGGLERVLGLELKLEEALGRPVDLFELEEAEGKPELLAEIANEGRAVIDRDGRWPELQGRRAELARAAARAERQRARGALAGIDRMLGR